MTSKVAAVSNETLDAIMAELQSAKDEYIDLEAQIRVLKARRSEIRGQVSFNGDSLVERYNHAVHQMAIDLLTGRQLGWCVAGSHVCDETKLCLAHLYITRDYSGPGGCGTSHKKVVATACQAHTDKKPSYWLANWRYDSFWQVERQIVSQVRNVDLVRKATSNYIHKSGFHNNQLRMFLHENGLPIDLYLDTDQYKWCYRPIPGSGITWMGRQFFDTD